jgi:hypothetical protein
LVLNILYISKVNAKIFLSIKSKSINHFKFLILTKPNGMIFWIARGTVQHSDIKKACVFNESARLDAVGMARDFLFK